LLVRQEMYIAVVAKARTRGPPRQRGTINRQLRQRLTERTDDGRHQSQRGSREVFELGLRLLGVGKEAQQYQQDRVVGHVEEISDRVRERIMNDDAAGGVVVK